MARTKKDATANPKAATPVSALLGVQSSGFPAFHVWRLRVIDQSRSYYGQRSEQWMRSLMARCQACANHPLLSAYREDAAEQQHQKGHWDVNPKEQCDRFDQWVAKYQKNQVSVDEAASSASAPNASQDQHQINQVPVPSAEAVVDVAEPQAEIEKEVIETAPADTVPSAEAVVAETQMENEKEVTETAPADTVPSAEAVVAESQMEKEVTETAPADTVPSAEAVVAESQMEKEVTETAPADTVPSTEAVVAESQMEKEVTETAPADTVPSTEAVVAESQMEKEVTETAPADTVPSTEAVVAESQMEKEVTETAPADTAPSEAVVDVAEPQAEIENQSIETAPADTVPSKEAAVDVAQLQATTQEAVMIALAHTAMQSYQEQLKNDVDSDWEFGDEVTSDPIEDLENFNAWLKEKGFSPIDLTKIEAGEETVPMADGADVPMDAESGKRELLSQKVNDMKQHPLFQQYMEQSATSTTLLWGHLDFQAERDIAEFQQWLEVHDEKQEKMTMKHADLESMNLDSELRVSLDVAAVSAEKHGHCLQAALQEAYDLETADLEGDSQGKRKRRKKMAFPNTSVSSTPLPGFEMGKSPFVDEWLGLIDLICIPIRIDYDLIHDLILFYSLM